MLWRIPLIIIIVFVLTVISQVGGLIFLLSLLLFPLINRKLRNRWSRAGAKIFVFIGIYTLCTFLIVPPLARSFGRVPLPVLKTKHVQPLNVGTCFLNRHYVRPPLRNALFLSAEKFNRDYPGSIVNYLDANFPFVDKFPLFPHLSHSDGKKLDIAFFYKETKTGIITDRHPSFIGYGACEQPASGEENMTAICERKGYWQYGLLQKIIPHDEKEKFEFDWHRTKSFIENVAEQNEINKILLEPYLKKRLKLTSDKIRFQGCQAVRHDDHMHVQLK